MKYWRKMGNKVTIKEVNGTYTTLTGRHSVRSTLYFVVYI